MNFSTNSPSISTQANGSTATQFDGSTATQVDGATITATYEVAAAT